MLIVIPQVLFACHKLFLTLQFNAEDAIYQFAWWKCFLCLGFQLEVIYTDYRTAVSSV